jgi:alkanesulfonate monooxygenase SsuD/methylene tetrahydromethanopterin reductase-like flavin-dependent oxidoreductase (luciferase family)
MKRSVAAAVASFAQLAPAAQELESAGFDRVWATELKGRDVVVRALHIAGATNRLQVGTGIAYAFTRHPLAMAAAAVEGQAATAGRFTVGVGAGTTHTRSEFGLEFDHPAPRLAEYVNLMRQSIDADGTLEFHGRFYDVSMPGFRFGHPREVLDSVRLYGAALNPLTLSAMSRVCDGLALHPFGHWTSHLQDVVLPCVASGGRENPRGTPDIAAWIIACAMPDADQARAFARAQIALYAAQPGFATFFESTPWAADAGTIRDRARLVAGRTDWAALGIELVPDSMLEGLAIAGEPDEVAERVSGREKELADAGVDELTLQIPGVALPAEISGDALSALAAAVSRPRP